MESRHASTMDDNFYISVSMGNLDFMEFLKTRTEI